LGQVPLLDMKFALESPEQPDVRALDPVLGALEATLAQVGGNQPFRS